MEVAFRGSLGRSRRRHLRDPFHDHAGRRAERRDRVEPIIELHVIPRAALHDAESAFAELDQRHRFPVPDTPVTSRFVKTARYRP